jgi:uncharacterized protein (TIGR00255 family)
MLKSMTGFGKINGEYLNKKISAEAKSINSKQFDLVLKTPSYYREKEMEWRNEVMRVLERGKIEINLQVEYPENTKGASINNTLVKNYFLQLKAIAEDLKIKNQDDLLTLAMRLPDIIKTEHQEIDEPEWAAVSGIVIKALEALDESRKREGKLLEQDFIFRIGLIEKLLEQIGPHEKQRIDNVKTKLRQALAEHLGNETDMNRFEQEIIYYLEKMDITEEKVRLANHLKYFLDTMKHEESPGKKLGFISQEIGREINTLGSKANDVNIQKLVIQMKDELEKIKEQLMNIL